MNHISLIRKIEKENGIELVDVFSETNSYGSTSVTYRTVENPKFNLFIRMDVEGKVFEAEIWDFKTEESSKIYFRDFETGKVIFDPVISLS